MWIREGFLQEAAFELDFRDWYGMQTAGGREGEELNEGTPVREAPESGKELQCRPESFLELTFSQFASLFCPELF